MIVPSCLPILVHATPWNDAIVRKYRLRAIYSGDRTFLDDGIIAIPVHQLRANPGLRLAFPGAVRALEVVAPSALHRNTEPDPISR